MSDVTRILSAIECEDAKATDELLPSVYKELRSITRQEITQATAAFDPTTFG